MQMNEVVFSFDVHQIISILKVSAPFLCTETGPPKWENRVVRAT